ncbi:hypothetical protein [Bradyrhizobium lablabi]|nr:hypothetical protein [Bradyrhizobium lablabi]
MSNTRPLTSKAINGISLLMAGCCLLFCVVLAFVAFEGARERHAQGDLGFYMILNMVTPGILNALVIAASLRFLLPDQRHLRTFLAICALSVAALLWDWLFLFRFWRAH